MDDTMVRFSKKVSDEDMKAALDLALASEEPSTLDAINASYEIAEKKTRL